MRVGRSDGRTVGQDTWKWLRVGSVLLVTSVLPLSTGTGQVGHPPSSSPYRDVPRAAGPIISVNYWEGVAGRADVGITNSIIAGLSYDIAIMGPLRVLVGLSYGRGERFVQDPPADAANRLTGPYTDSFLLPEAEVQLLITGHKSWRRIVPYLTISGGFLMGGAEPAADTSDYQLGNKFVYSPGVGFRFYPAGGRLRAMIDARMLFLKLSYPPEFFVEGDDGTAVLDSSQDSEQWTHSQRIRIGVGWTF